jgi:DNA-binding NtrC family response regulator/pSer/pThr/pTyr-binding forkhead associated (FHA) protein
MSQDQIETEDSRRASAGPGSVAERQYLLLLEGNSSVLCPLPRGGSLVIGRAQGSDITVEDPSVSRQHARVVVEGGEVFIADLDSHNGVRVNGEQVSGTQPLYSGDVVMLGNVTLVFHRGGRPVLAHPVLDAPALRARLAEEMERVHRYERAVSVLVVEPGPTSEAPEALARAAGSALRLMDSVGRLGSTLAVVLPELAEEEAREAAEHVLEVLSPLAARLRAGLATAPQDGLDAEALMAAARAAALAAPVGGLRVSGPDLYRLSLGARSVVVADAAMVHLFEQLRRLAASPLPVLIHGQSGAGKENAAWAVHHWSPRAAGPFEVINCATLQESLAEDTLFGHERGAFSGADRAHPGLLERASGGTLFLDEIADLSPPVQAKLLRALEQQRITRLGDTRERQVDVRVVAASHRELAKEVREGRFRQDLYFRLAGAQVTLPPLRDRPLELPLLARTFLDEACARVGRPSLHLSAAVMGVLGAYSWPGNVRELKNALAYVAATAPGPIVEPSHLPEAVRQGGGEGLAPPDAPPVAAPVPAAAPPGFAREDLTAKPAPGTFRPIAEELRELERQRMVEALEATGGVQTRAAQLIGMPLRTFCFKLKQYRIPPRGSR